MDFVDVFASFVGQWTFLEVKIHLSNVKKFIPAGPADIFPKVFHLSQIIRLKYARFK
jgi:hypothetical protein